MAVVISTSSQEKVFDNIDVINVGTNPNCDFVLNLDIDVLLTIQYDQKEHKCMVMNTFHNDKILFKGKPVKKVEVGNICKLMFADTEEYVSIKVISSVSAQKTVSSIAKEEFTEEDIKGLYGNDVNAITKVKIEKQKEDIEKSRVSIIKDVAFKIHDYQKKLATNNGTSLFLHIAMFLASMLCAFGVANYLMGLPIQETTNYLHLPANLKVWIVYSILIYGVCLIMKQGVYQYLQNSIAKEVSSSAKFGQYFLIGMSSLIMVGVYAVNLMYFMNIRSFAFFAVVLGIFFTGIAAVLAIGCGYFKNNGQELAVELNKYEYREDFESVLKSYNQWIDRYINSFSNTRISNIKDKIFNLQLKSMGEIFLGILTAPFLAYGVSNTLAMCFPEAAGWMRISGLRFSPIFLVLATFMIIFAFFAFVNAFLATKKIQASQVIKQDGFNDFQHHGVTIYGLEGVRRLASDRTRSLIIACSIIVIEFTMNISYFMTEIGGDLQGMFISLLAALVPTAILIAETYMLSQTKFDIYAREELLAKIDKD